VICYSAMLDFENTDYQHVPQQDASCAACIQGKGSKAPLVTKFLEHIGEVV